MKKQSVLSVLLVALIGASSCASETTTNQLGEGVAESEQTVNENIETDRSQISDDLPNVTYNGEDFNILYRNEWAYEFLAEEETGDIINDAIHKRNRKVEERFNISLKLWGIAGTWNSSEFRTAVNNSVLAGDSEYDFIAGYQADMVSPAMEGYFMNICDMQYINPEAPYWSEKSNSALTVNGKLFMTTGDIALTLWDNMYVFYFNKKLAQQYQLPDVYELVKNGEWTIDKLYELSSNVSDDLNGDTEYDENDLYGFITTFVNHSRAWIVAGETPITKFNSDGFAEACFVTERSQSMLDKLLKLYSSESTYTKNETLNEPNNTEEPVIFASDRALFMSGYLGNASILRNMNTDFGIIPYPMYDENQDGYRTTAHNSVSMICFPVTVKDPEMSAIIAEALCAESYRNVIPQYYDLVLKAKGARDSESEEMIDIIRDGLTFDFGWVHSMSMDMIGSIYQSLLQSNSSGLSSYWATKENKVLAGLETINEAYSD